MHTNTHTVKIQNLVSQPSKNLSIKYIQTVTLAKSSQYIYQLNVYHI